MLYEFTGPDGADMRADIGGLMMDWCVNAIDVMELGKWVDLPRGHPQWTAIIAHLLQPGLRAKIDDAYAEHVIERIDDNYYRRSGDRGCGRVVDKNDEHRLRTWEVV